MARPRTIEKRFRGGVRLIGFWSLSFQDRRFAIPDCETQPPYTRDELAALIKGLSAAEKVRLTRVAQHFAGMCRWEWRDLYQEAMRRCFDTRSCPRGVSVVTFLANSMRSIASSEWKQRLTQPVLVAVGGADDLAGFATDHEPSAEDRLLREEERAERLMAIDALFENDEESRMVVMGMSEGLAAADIREIGGWTDTQYATIRRRMRRQINDRFGGGWSA